MSAPAADPDCKHPAGAFAPEIDRNRCEAREDCVRVCPYDVFEIAPLAASDKRPLSLVGRLKEWVS